MSRAEAIGLYLIVALTLAYLGWHVWLAANGLRPPVWP